MKPEGSTMVTACTCCGAHGVDGWHKEGCIHLTLRDAVKQARRLALEEAAGIAHRVKMGPTTTLAYRDAARAIEDAIRALATDPEPSKCPHCGSPDCKQAGMSNPSKSMCKAEPSKEEKPPRITKEEVQEALKRGAKDAAEMGQRIAETFSLPTEQTRLCAPSEPEKVPR